MPRLRGTVLREVPVQLVDLSLSGCLLKTSEEIPDGARGRLQVMMGGGRYREELRIVRSIVRAGLSPPGAHLVGGEFSPSGGASEAPVPGGVRKIVPQL